MKFQPLFSATSMSDNEQHALPSEALRFQSMPCLRVWRVTVTDTIKNNLLGRRQQSPTFDFLAFLLCKFKFSAWITFNPPGDLYDENLYFSSASENT